MGLTYIDKTHSDQWVDELCVELKLVFHIGRGCVPRLNPLLVVVVPIEEAGEELFVL